MRHADFLAADLEQPTVRSGKAPDADAAALEGAARDFRAFRQAHPSGEVAQWCASFAGSRLHAEIFRDLYRADPVAADRLALALADMPAVGNEFLGFRLLAELGSGAMSRVYLARQGDLADRPVALKVAPDLGGEVLTLAQLQHTNIVPIYSVHHTPLFQAVCMPYLGSTTLEAVLRELRGSGVVPDTGLALLTTKHLRPTTALGNPDHQEITVSIRRRRIAPQRPVVLPEPSVLPAPTAPAEPTGPVVQMLRGFSYVEAVLWVASRLADGLAHAHERGIIHRDLKPANVLLTDDGQPLLLDFNVADDTKRRTGAAAWVGGTLPYMSPEHLDAFAGDVPAVDARSDLYSFGIILYELLTGRYPFAVRSGLLGSMLDVIRADRRRPPPSLRQYNPAVTPAVEAIVRRCLEPDPARRYQHAREVQVDLERHRANLPLQHTPEPSLAERARKWTRRHPRLMSSSGVGAVAALLLVVLAAGLGVRGYRLAQLETRDKALAEWAAFQDEARTAQSFLYARQSDRGEQQEGVEAGTRALGRYQVLDDPAWQQRDIVQALPASEREPLRAAVGGLLLLLARATINDRKEDPEKVQEGLRLNQLAAEAYAELAVSPVLWRQRAELTARLGDKEGAGRFEAQAAALPLQTARDHYWLAAEHFLAGRTAEALPLFQRAARLDPQNFWAWWALGNCYDRLGHDARAEACYTTALTVRPDYYQAYFNRGLAALRQKNYADAAADFSEVMRLNPPRRDLAQAQLHRAVARQGLGQHEGAADDLTQALANGAPETRIYYLRARSRERLGDLAGARQDRDEALRREPNDETSWVARGYARMAREPEAALADFDQALRLNPDSATALQNKAHVLAEKLDRTEEAIAALNRLLARAPYAAAARGGRAVLYARLGRRAEAIQDAEETLLCDTSPTRLYQMACVYALTSRQEPDDKLHALRLLASALRRGYGLDVLRSDSDLDPIRNDAAFRRLVEEHQAAFGAR